MVESEPNSTWIRLRTGKEFSRLLYPNPVCFLSTVPLSTSVSSKTAVTEMENCHRSNDRRMQQHAGNVMVLSWLTPTNNSGRFVFSVNKSRYTTSLLAPPSAPREDIVKHFFQTGIEFLLSVPTQGMEQIILDTGSISGRCRSKFSSERVMDSQNHSTNNELNDIGSVDPISNRKRKKLKKLQLSSQGVSGLRPIPYLDVSDPSSPQTSLFVIDGTVAHLKCRTYGILGSSLSDENSIADSYDETRQPIIDHDHLLVMAEVIDARVHPSYWDSKKMIFRPKSKEVSPYLTFQGAQTFGYVTTL